MPRALCPVLIMLASALGAADGVLVSDVRLAIGTGTLPHEQEGELTSPVASAGTPIETRYERTIGLSVTLGGIYGRLAPVGFLWGAQLRSTTGEMAYQSLRINNGAAFNSDQLAAANNDKVPGMSYSQTGIAANLGVGWAVSRDVHLELLGLIGPDWVTWDSIANLGVGDLSVQQGQGYGYTVGGRLGAYWTDPDSQWQFGLEGEFTRSKARIKTSYIDVTVETEPVAVGPAFRAVLGHRF